MIQERERNFGGRQESPFGGNHKSDKVMNRVLQTTAEERLATAGQNARRFEASKYFDEPQILKTTNIDRVQAALLESSCEDQNSNA